MPPHNKALSKLQDLCTYPVWSQPAVIIFSKVQVPKILIQFPSEASKTGGGGLALIFLYFKFCTSYIGSIVQKETGPYKRFLLA